LAGLTRPHDVTVDNIDSSFKGTFFGGYKNEWEEPWGLTFDSHSLEFVTNPQNWHGGAHPGPLIAVVADTLAGDLDVVVWPETRTGPSEPPTIYRALHLDAEYNGATINDQPWNVRYHYPTRRYVASFRVSNRVISFRLHGRDRNYEAYDIRDVVTPPPANAPNPNPTATFRDEVSKRSTGLFSPKTADGILSTRRATAGQYIWHPEGLAFDDDSGDLLIGSHTLRTIYRVPVSSLTTGPV
jgi:hypothetical protein